MKTTRTQNLLAAALIGALAFTINSTEATTMPTPDEARAIAREAFIYAYAPIQGYQTLYNQTQSPGADKESNWLPAPAGPFFMVIRMYGPEQRILSGGWKEPALKRVE